VSVLELLRSLLCSQLLSALSRVIGKLKYMAKLLQLLADADANFRRTTAFGITGSFHQSLSVRL
jgi:hypothetical protein